MDAGMDEYNYFKDKNIVVILTYQEEQLAETVPSIEAGVVVCDLLNNVARRLSDSDNTKLVGAQLCYLSGTSIVPIKNSEISAYLEQKEKVVENISLHVNKLAHLFTGMD